MMLFRGKLGFGLGAEGGKYPTVDEAWLSLKMICRESSFTPGVLHRHRPRHCGPKHAVSGAKTTDEICMTCAHLAMPFRNKSPMSL